MGWPVENLEMPEAVRELIRKENCCLFIGSGLSAGSYDSWPDLINALCKQCGSNHHVTLDTPPDLLLDAAQDAKDHNEESYYRYLGDHFGKAANQASLLYDILLTLPFRCYLTVNFDPLLAFKARTAKLDCSLPPRAYPSLDRLHSRNRSIHYLHGMISPGEKPVKGSIVLARKEFDEAYDNNSNLMNFLVPTLENDPIIFVGCGLREPTMHKVFDICKKHQMTRQKIAAQQGSGTARAPKRFIFLPKPIVDYGGHFDGNKRQEELDNQTNYYTLMDITPIWYVAQGNDHTALNTAFETIAELPSIKPCHTWDGGNYGP
jgi:hypothetical protein